MNTLYEKDSFVKLFKNLGTYKFENNFILEYQNKRYSNLLLEESKTFLLIMLEISMH